MEPIIVARGLSRSYQTYEKPQGFWSSITGLWNRKHTEKVALFPVDLEIFPGQIVGLIGANGAGKTTLLKILSGLIHPTAGDAHVLQNRPWERGGAFLRQVSILLGQKNQLWWDISPLDSFQLLSHIYDLDPAACMKKVDELATLLDCRHVLKTQLRRLSLGERMKMEIIGSLLHNPKVLFLDEPTIGLDVLAQNTIRSFIGEHLRGTGQTIILTSHYMNDISSLADRLLVMSHGKLVYDGTVPGFTAQIGGQQQRLIVDFSTPVVEDILLLPGVAIAKGSSHYSHDFLPEETPLVIKKLMERTHIQEVKIEEPDFENVIYRFLAKESRGVSSRDAL